MRFSDLDENFVISELGAAPAMIGQAVQGQPVAPPSGTAAPVNQVSQQQVKLREWRSRQVVTY